MIFYFITIYNNFLLHVSKSSPVKEFHKKNYQIPLDPILDRLFILNILVQTQSLIQISQTLNERESKKKITTNMNAVHAILKSLD